jgi:hypothetical protein
VGKTCPKNERNTNSKKAIERQGRSQKGILKRKEKKRLKKTSKDARHIGADILVSRSGYVEEHACGLFFISAD